MRWFLPGKLSSSLVLLGILLLLVMYLTTRFESLDALSVTTGGGLASYSSLAVFFDISMNRGRSRRSTFLYEHGAAR